jgi:hypothetical protein
VNTRLLWSRYGWNGLLLDGSGKNNNWLYPFDRRVIHNHFIKAETIVAIFEQYDVPKDLDILSVDIDRNDFYVAEAIFEAGYRPSGICFFQITFQTL